MESLEKKREKNGVKMKQVRNRKQNEKSGHCKRRDGEKAWKTEFVMNRKKRIKWPENRNRKMKRAKKIRGK